MKQLSQSKQKIHDAALKLFAEKGYTSCSMSIVAETVGVKKATLYSHFKNKEEIFRLILETIISRHEKSVNRLVDNAAQQNSILYLQTIFFDYIKFCKGNIEVDFWTRFYYFPPEELEEEILRKTHEYERLFQSRLIDIIQSGINRGEIVDRSPKDIMISYYYLMLGFVMSLNFYRDKDIKPDAESCISVFLDGIKK
ncbi:TetR/AcrR family transcriptional regulator [Marispirochaeta aestuarii]|uniref:TetR/AcrR family transcriptional regulator n=1 Tax=Marispirochaeta aestuarii TaxID=1963862 RepID=UPI0029C7069C|nr:TetR/AcrR family transcriptional regulator [Marispirochaeta aestuarii]